MIVAEAIKAVDSIEDVLGIKYPYDKLDIVSVPDFAVNGMENAGLIMLSETLLNEANEHSSRSVTVHEVAHQWFGNYVTPRDWEDVWLSESLSDWLGFTILNSSVVDSVTLREEALRWMESQGAPIRQQPLALDLQSFAPRSAIDTGTALVKLIEAQIGRRTLYLRLASFIRNNADRTASTEEFLSSLGGDTGTFAAIVATGLPPRVDVALDCSTATPFISIAADHADLNVCVKYDGDRGSARKCADVPNGGTTLPLDSSRCPRWFNPNPDGAKPYRTNWTRAVVVSLTKYGGSQFTDTEKQTLFHEIDDDGLRLLLSYVTLQTTTSADAAKALYSLSAFMPPELKRKFSRWYSQYVQPASRRTDWTASADSANATWLTLLAAAAEDLTLVRRAAALAPSFRGVPVKLRDSVISLASIDRKTATLLTEMLVSNQKLPTSRLSMLTALGRSATAFSVLVTKPKLLHAFSPSELADLLAASCNTKRMEDVRLLAAANPKLDLSVALNTLENCLSRAKGLSSQFVEWLDAGRTSP